jgi:hypothetical protein
MLGVAPGDVLAEETLLSPACWTGPALPIALRLGDQVLRCHAAAGAWR